MKDGRSDCNCDYDWWRWRVKNRKKEIVTMLMEIRNRGVVRTRGVGGYDKKSSGW